MVGLSRKESESSLPLACLSSVFDTTDARVCVRSLTVAVSNGPVLVALYMIRIDP